MWLIQKIDIRALAFYIENNIIIYKYRFMWVESSREIKNDNLSEVSISKPR